MDLEIKDELFWEGDDLDIVDVIDKWISKKDKSKGRVLYYDGRPRNNHVSPMNQLLTALRFYACNSHQISVGDFMGLNQSTVSRIVSKVSNAIAGLRPLYIKMPSNNEILHIQENFYRIARFPRVVGCIDGTRIKIQSPGGEDGEIYRNRKSVFSLNTQVVCGPDLKIQDIVARWPGSTHDAVIFNNSRLLGRFENGEFGSGILLGDSGYALRPFLLTPLLNPIRRYEQLYNESHIRTRNSVERLIGVWKRRFPVLAYGFRCSIQNVMTIIVATAVLHNIAIEQGEVLPPPPEEINQNMLNYLIDQGNIPDVLQNVEINGPGYNYRHELITSFFANL